MKSVQKYGSCNELHLCNAKSFQEFSRVSMYTVFSVRVCWSECLLYCEAFLGCIGQSGNVRIENFLGAHTLENVSGQSMGGICVEHRAVCGERDSALPHLPPQQQQPRGPVRLRGLKIDTKQPPPASPSLAQGFHKPPASPPQPHLLLPQVSA